MDINISVGHRGFVKYDENLFEVYVLNYDDNYHRSENEPSSEFEKEVRKIKARYRDINKYYNACALYSEYMSYLESIYGGPKLFKLKLKFGRINEFIPPKPRIKKNKELKFLKKNRIIIGATGKDLIDMDKLEEILQYYDKDFDSDKVSVSGIKDKDADKIVDSDSFNRSKRFKRLKSESFKNDSEYLEEYFKNKNYNGGKNKKKKKKGKKKDKERRLMISDFMRSDYEERVYGKEYMDSVRANEEDEPMVYYNGVLLSSETNKDLDVYRRLNELGWNSYKLMKRTSYSNKITNMFKPPKKQKKKKNKKKSQGIYDGLLIDILTDNGIGAEEGYESFEEFQMDMLDMTSANVFK